MNRVEFDIVGVSPYSQSQPILTKKGTGETHDVHEQRTWRERMHVNKEGFVFVPPMALKNCLAEVARYISESVPGKGKATYTKHFEAGIMVVEPMVLNIKAADVQPTKLFVPADGKRGSGKRVWKYFPTITEWKCHAVVYVLDPVLADSPDKIREYAEYAGRFIGMGYFRPRNNGYWGRFEVTNFRVFKSVD